MSVSLPACSSVCLYFTFAVYVDDDCIEKSGAANIIFSLITALNVLVFRQ